MQSTPAPKSCRLSTRLDPATRSLASVATIPILTGLAPSWILPIPGTPFIYTADTYWIRAFDVTSSTLVAQILLPGMLKPGSPQLVGNLLYGRQGAALLLACVFVASGLALLLVIRRLWSDQSPPAPPGETHGV